MEYFWFPYLATAINLLIIWFMPKNLTKQEIYILWLVLSAIAFCTDLLFGGVFDLFDYGPNSDVTLWGYPIELLLSPSSGIIFLNFMPKERVRFVKYFILWVVFSTCFEWLSLKFNCIFYKGWQLWYSTVIYIFTFIFIRWHFNFIRGKV